MVYPRLCQYHQVSRFPPPVLLYFDRHRKRSSEDQKPYHKIHIASGVKAHQFMRGTFLSLSGKLTDPYKEWHKWETNGDIIHLSRRSISNLEDDYASALVILFTSKITTKDKSTLASVSQSLLQHTGIRTVAVDCAVHDEVCVSTFRPLSFPAVYFKKTAERWHLYQGKIEMDAIVDWAQVENTVHIKQYGTKQNINEDL